MNPLHPDIAILQIVAKGLGPLCDQVVFVGGATTTLYIDDPASPESVATQDVDCVIELTGSLSYNKLEKQLRDLKFKQPVHESKFPICRWVYKDIIVDIMPSDPKYLGFSNIWYPEGILNREEIKLPNGTLISIFSLPFFIASKLEAVKNRGGNDLRFSHDLEDIILVLSGNQNAESILLTAPTDVLKYLKSEFKKLKNNPLFEEAIQGVLMGHGEPVTRSKYVQELLSNFLSQNKSLKKNQNNPN